MGMVWLEDKERHYFRRWKLNKDNKAINLHLVGEMKGMRRKGMRISDGQKQQSEVQ